MASHTRCCCWDKNPQDQQGRSLHDQGGHHRQADSTNLLQRRPAVRLRSAWGGGRRATEGGGDRCKARRLRTRLHSRSGRFLRSLLARSVDSSRTSGSSTGRLSGGEALAWDFGAGWTTDTGADRGRGTTTGRESARGTSLDWASWGQPREGARDRNLAGDRRLQWSGRLLRNTWGTRGLRCRRGHRNRHGRGAAVVVGDDDGGNLWLMLGVGGHIGEARTHEHHGLRSRPC